MFKSRASFLRDKFKTAKTSAEPHAKSIAGHPNESFLESTSGSLHNHRVDFIAEQALDQLDDDIEKWNDEFESWGQQWQAQIREFNFDNVRSAAFAVHQDKQEAIAFAEQSKMAENSPYAADAISLRSKSSAISIAVPNVSDYSDILDTAHLNGESSPRDASSPATRKHYGKGKVKGRTHPVHSLIHHSASPFKKAAAYRGSWSPLSKDKAAHRRVMYESSHSTSDSDSASIISGDAIAAYYAIEAASPESTFDDDDSMGHMGSPGKKERSHTYRQFLA